jgi:hypothetical protein
MTYYQASPSAAPHRQIGHGDINKTIQQLLVNHLTLCPQRLPTKSRSEAQHCLAVPSALRHKKKKTIAPEPRFSGVEKKIQLPVTKSY